MRDHKGFDLWADGYDADVDLTDRDNAYPFAGYKNILGSIYGTIIQRPGAAVLDVGFGTGTLAAKLYEKQQRRKELSYWGATSVSEIWYYIWSVVKFIIILMIIFFAAKVFYKKVIKKE